MKVRLAVRGCEIIGAGDEIDNVHSVQCPLRRRAMAFEQCCGCPDKTAIDVDVDGKSATVECDTSVTDPPRARVDVAEAALRVRVGSILGLESLCVRSDMRVRAAAELFDARSLRSVPVVDEARRLVGVVSKTDLLRRTQSRRRPQTVAEIMNRSVRRLPEDTSLVTAISLMAFERLDEIPVVDANDQLVGVVTAIDALRWMAGALGYVQPEQR